MMDKLRRNLVVVVVMAQNKRLILYQRQCHHKSNSMAPFLLPKMVYQLHKDWQMARLIEQRRRLNHMIH
jgi:hypothetical protein